MQTCIQKCKYKVVCVIYRHGTVRSVITWANLLNSHFKYSFDVIHRTLEENLNPQPLASTVIHRLLDWIDRVDEASIEHLAKPNFATKGGEPIFPEEEDAKWWLTDVQNRSTTISKIDPQEGDEDGPASDENVEAVAEETSDEDPLSVDGDNEGHEKETKASDKAFKPLARVSRVAWHGKRDVYYDGFFERQRAAHCGMHALNNAVGWAWQTEEDMQFALDNYLHTMRFEGVQEIRAKNGTSSGWYSSEVLCHAVQTTSMRKADRLEYEMKLEPLHTNPAWIRECIGAVVNIEDIHWVALRYDGEAIWLFDSQESEPQALTSKEYEEYIKRWRNAFPIFKQ